MKLVCRDGGRETRAFGLPSALRRTSKLPRRSPGPPPARGEPLLLRRAIGAAPLGRGRPGGLGRAPPLGRLLPGRRVARREGRVPRGRGGLARETGVERDAAPRMRERTSGGEALTRVRERVRDRVFCNVCERDVRDRADRVRSGNDEWVPRRVGHERSFGVETPVPRVPDAAQLPERVREERRAHSVFPRLARARLAVGAQKPGERHELRASLLGGHAALAARAPAGLRRVLGGAAGIAPARLALGDAREERRRLRRAGAVSGDGLEQLLGERALLGVRGERRGASAVRAQRRRQERADVAARPGGNLRPARLHHEHAQREALGRRAGAGVGPPRRRRAAGAALLRRDVQALVARVLTRVSLPRALDERPRVALPRRFGIGGGRGRGGGEKRAGSRGVHAHLPLVPLVHLLVHLLVLILGVSGSSGSVAARALGPSAARDARGRSAVPLGRRRGPRRRQPHVPLRRHRQRGGAHRAEERPALVRAGQQLRGAAEHVQGVASVHGAPRPARVIQPRADGGFALREALDGRERSQPAQRLRVGRVAHEQRVGEHRRLRASVERRFEPVSVFSLFFFVRRVGRRRTRRHVSCRSVDGKQGCGMTAAARAPRPLGETLSDHLHRFARGASFASAPEVRHELALVPEPGGARLRLRLAVDLRAEPLVAVAVAPSVRGELVGVGNGHRAVDVVPGHRQVSGGHAFVKLILVHHLGAVLEPRDHLVPLLPSPNVRPHVFHGFFRDRFQQVVLRAEAQTVEHHVGVLVAAHHHDGHLVQDGVLAHAVEQRRPVHVRHHHVRQQQVELRAALQERERLAAARRGGHCRGKAGRVESGAVRKTSRGHVTGRLG